MAKGLGATEIAKRLGIARTSVYRVAWITGLICIAISPETYAAIAATGVRRRSTVFFDAIAQLRGTQLRKAAVALPERSTRPGWL
jgi:hypothetical protein